MKNSRKASGWMILSVLFLTLVINIGAIAEAPEPGPCEIALYRCLNDPLYFGTSDGVFHCLLGYLFCKKYIDRV